MVSMTPTPLPSNIDSTPFMTWGEIEGTPCRLDANDVPIDVAPVGTPYFRIPETSKRDALAQSLTDKLSSKNREKKKKALDHATRSLKSPLVGGTPSDRLSEMSPAAQRLATAKLGFSGSSDKALRASYSPAINVTPSPRRSHSRATPSPALFPSGASKPCNTASSSTDNLLKKSKRSKASDFF
ncbi:hypothetical protein HDE_06512 [Halotydeus destructor]|nr:hypothetical protein HDE_06512 [Halotydeus destructor]